MIIFPSRHSVSSKNYLSHGACTCGALGRFAPRQYYICHWRMTISMLTIRCSNCAAGKVIAYATLKNEYWHNDTPNPFEPFVIAVSQVFPRSYILCDKRPTTFRARPVSLTTQSKRRTICCARHTTSLFVGTAQYTPPTRDASRCLSAFHTSLHACGNYWSPRDVPTNNANMATRRCAQMSAAI